MCCPICMELCIRQLHKKPSAICTFRENQRTFLIGVNEITSATWNRVPYSIAENVSPMSLCYVTGIPPLAVFLLFAMYYYRCVCVCVLRQGILREHIIYICNRLVPFREMQVPPLVSIKRKAYHKWSLWENAEIILLLLRVVPDINICLPKCFEHLYFHGILDAPHFQ